jgi:hypothetical protein
MKNQILALMLDPLLENIILNSIDQGAHRVGYPKGEIGRRLRLTRTVMSTSQTRTQNGDIVSLKQKNN